MVFEREITLIKNDTLREMVRGYFETTVPAYFWEIGASSSGKYHPVFSQGEGGLVRHTQAVVMFAEEFLRMSPFCYLSDEHKDFVIAACLVHDTMKYGTGAEMEKSEYKNHAQNAAKAFRDYCFEHGYPVSEFMTNAISAHMGQWSTDKNCRPFTSIDRCVHMADYVASRPFIDIPVINA